MVFHHGHENLANWPKQIGILQIGQNPKSQKPNNSANKPISSQSGHSWTKSTLPHPIYKLV
jgi:hypothetical protein